VAVSILKLVYIVPPLAAIFANGAARRWGMIGYCAGVTSRVIVAHTTRQPTLPDVLAHPISIGVLAALTRRSIDHTKAGTLTWRGRALNAVYDSSGEVAQ
jgi:hypothetical protein